MNIKYSRKAEKYLKKCDKNLAKRLLEEIEALTKNPYPKDSTNVEGRKDNAQRIRVGKQRIIYFIIKENNELFVADIDKRGRVYD